MLYPFIDTAGNLAIPANINLSADYFKYLLSPYLVKLSLNILLIY
jgi:hypothetical protein